MYAIYYTEKEVVVKMRFHFFLLDILLEYILQIINRY